MGDYRDVRVALGKDCLMKNGSIQCSRMGDFRDERVVLGKVD